MPFEFEVRLPRNAFSARDAARAGDVWRALQDVALLGSGAAGWPPSLYKVHGIAFVVRNMTVVHDRETIYGEDVRAKTWISMFRRGLLITRQIRLEGKDGSLARATQEWAHVKVGDDGQMRPARAADDLVSAFQIEDNDPDATLPPFDKMSRSRTHSFKFPAWFTWMDPLDHANHPAYVDWCDEAISRSMSAAGLDPLLLQPVAEHVKWSAGVIAPGDIEVRTRVAGNTPSGSVVCDHDILQGGEKICATARTIRRLADGDQARLQRAMR